jgi:hypothetical protein
MIFNGFLVKNLQVGLNNNDMKSSISQAPQTGEINSFAGFHVAIKDKL